MKKKKKNHSHKRREIHKNDDPSLTEGVIVESLPEAMFKVRVEGGEEHLGYLAGKMRLYRIRVFVGDKVLMKLDEYGGKARITRRL